ncbi:TPA: hypothetical protein DCE37_20250 [Candidatus Latescibacteria bacterium]|nr:hypothetical protein [Candidatus Latescibacterota bacterium]
MGLEEVRQLAPGVVFDGFCGGSLSGSDGHVDAIRAVQALHDRCRLLGVDVRLGE